MPLTTTLADLLRPALRMAGVTMRPGITPSQDQFNELIPAVNRMLQSANCNGHTIYATSIQQFELNSGQKIYTIGPGGDFNTTRPQFIRDANLIFPTNPQLRTPLQLLDEHEWSLIQMQDINNSLPWGLFYNPTYGSTGRGTIYLAFQPPEQYLLELYTWTLLPGAFSSVTDLVQLPDGYEEYITTGMAIRAAALYPRDSALSNDARDLHRRAYDNLLSLNTKCPTLRSEAEFLGRGGNWQWSGMFAAGGSSGGGVSLVTFTLTGAIDGTTGSDGNATFTTDRTPTFLQLYKNGVFQYPDISYTRTGATITFLAPNIPVTGDLLFAIGTIASS